MNYVYASLLLHSAGKPITEDGIKKVVAAAGENPDEAKVKTLVAALEGVDIKSAIEKAAMPVAVAAPVAASSGEAQPKKEEQSEEEMEKKAETAAEGLAALFG